MANEFIARRGIINLGNTTVTGNEVITGSLTVLGGITGTITGSATSASYAINASFLNNSGSGEFVPTGSFNTFSSSILTYTGSANSRFSSLETTSGSNISRLSSLEARTGSYATTGSNTFIGNQTITGSILGSGSLTINGCITATGQIVAQTINVQQVTSSIVYSCGSNTFGTVISNTQTMTGSVFITGSLVVTTTAPELQVGATGVTLGNVITDNHNVTGSLRVSGSVVSVGNACFASVCSPTIIGGTVCTTMGNFSCVGIGTMTPANAFNVSNNGASGFEVSPTGGVGSGVLLQAYNRSTSAYMAQSYYACTHTFNVGGGGATRALDISNTGVACFSNAICSNTVSTTDGTNVSTLANNYLRYNGGDFYVDACAVGGNFRIRTSNTSALDSTALFVCGRNSNIGIGTTTPGHRLDVNGTGRYIGSLTINEDGGGTKVLTVRSDWAGVDPAINVTTNNCLLLMTNNTVRVCLSNTGIATFSCTACVPSLVINANCIINPNNSGVEIWNGEIKFGATMCMYQAQPNGAFSDRTDLVFVTNCGFGLGVSEKMRLTAGGSLGLGTNSPSRQFEVYSCSTDRGGFIRSSNCATAGIISSYFEMFIGGCAMSIATWRNAGILEAVTTCGMVLSAFCNNIAFQVGNRSEVMRITGNGVGIGTATPCSALEIFSRAADADRTIPHNVLTITAEQGNAPYGFFGGSILFRNRSYVSGLVNSSRIRSVIYDDGAPANCGGGLWFESTSTPGGTLTPALAISYAGRVGIGCTLPTYHLEVRCAASTSSCYLAAMFSRTTGAADGVGDIVAFGANGVSSIAGIFRTAGSWGLELQTANQNTRMRIDNSGNVGINTLTPNARLEVYPGTISNDACQEIIRLDIPGANIFSAATGYINFRGYDVSNNVQRDVAWIGTQLVPEGAASNWFGGNLVFRTTASGNAQTPQERMRITSTGQVAIGNNISTSTEANLFLGAQGPIEGGQLVLQRGTNCSCATHLDNYQNQFRIMSGTDTGSTIANVILDHRTGNFGINVVPSYQLDVQLPSGINGQILRLGRSAGAYYWSIGIDGVGSCLNFYNNNNTSIAVISPVTGVYTATSDCRVKSNITDSCSVLDKILQVKVRQYIWNESCEREDYGLIAQEVNEVLPQYVKQGNENTNWGISKSEFVPALIKAIQEQQCIINTLKTCLGII